jgi:hypothetical protein
VRRYQFLISAGAQEDLHRCKQADRYAASKIAVVLRELASDELACDALVDEHVYDHLVESVSPLWYLQDVGINGYRVRIIELHGWRLITAADHSSKRVGLFAVMKRDVNYEDDAELTARITKEYDDYGFRRL